MTETTDILERIGRYNRFGSILGLERMENLLKKLGDPHKELSVIHVAGTNGKGSVCRFIQSALSACGYRTGLYTSPFLERFNERISMDGEDITDGDLEVCGSRVLAAAEEMEEEGCQPPTEFEVVTAAAFLYFREKKVDIAVLEVGLGGRGDSTNVVEKPLASVITSISYDHTDRLGNTLREIAGEKAGIIKPGCPVVSAAENPEAARAIAKKAYEMGSRLYDVSRIPFSIREDSIFSQKVTMELFEKDYSDVEISMAGCHQAGNLRTALATLEILRRTGKIKVDREKLYRGLKEARQPGRFEMISDGNDGRPAILIDGAHNEAAAEALKETVLRYFSGKRILLVAGVLAEKQADRMLDHMTEITKDIIATEPDSPRRLEAGKLADLLRLKGIEPVASAKEKECLRIAESLWKDYDLVVFSGSLYLIGNVRRRLRNEHGEKSQ
ncbi:MAG TPA: bifunctional folylpolyglutamate synthase/dihydrofolate synthase [Candidatus Copromorpha excrementigallinarum]|uniref:tetrahydrofolate synthase n=1 Tax=Candidatus Allocopromorpha excrementigallinarum TaxID=2840742 RepID=A0A9D1L6A8_9FIRM|nr:bifunctional folylpolyglutamate synthase/dihydrofolate synthase [Candidatus Copromorpha excrementigallinarum]